LEERRVRLNSETAGVLASTTVSPGGTRPKQWLPPWKTAGLQAQAVVKIEERQQCIKGIVYWKKPFEKCQGVCLAPLRLPMVLFVSILKGKPFS